MEGNLLPVVASLFRRSFFTGHMSRESLRISQSTARPQLVAGDLSGCSHRLAATARGDETYERGRNSRKDGYQSRGRFAIRERTLSVERVTSRQSYVSWESWPRRGYAAPRQGRDLEAATVDNARHLQALLEKEEVRGTVARGGEGRETKEGVRKEYDDERSEPRELGEERGREKRRTDSLFLSLSVRLKVRRQPRRSSPMCSEGTRRTETWYR